MFPLIPLARTFRPNGGDVFLVFVLSVSLGVKLVASTACLLAQIQPGGGDPATLKVSAWFIRCWLSDASSELIATLEIQNPGSGRSFRLLFHFLKKNFHVHLHFLDHTWTGKGHLLVFPA